MCFISIADLINTVDRSIVRCSGTQQILAIFLQPRPNDFSRAGLIFLWLLSLHQGKESDKQANTQHDFISSTRKSRACYSKMKLTSSETWTYPASHGNFQINCTALTDYQLPISQYPAIQQSAHPAMQQLSALEYCQTPPECY